VNQAVFAVSEPFFLFIARVLDAGTGYILFLFAMDIAGGDALEAQKMGGMVFGITLLIFHFQGIYRSFRFATLRYEIRKIFSACLFLFFFLIIMTYMLDGFERPPQKGLLMWMVCWPLLLAVMRIVYRKTLRAIRKRGFNQKTAVIAGESMAGIKLARHIQENAWSGTQILGFFSDRGECGSNRSIKGMHCLGSLDDIDAYTSDRRVDIIYIALSDNDESAMLRLMKRVEGLPSTIYLVPNVFFLDLVIGGEIIFFDQRPMIVLRDTPLAGLAGVGKRAMDIVISLALIILGAPVFLAAGLAVKLSSPGPLIFVQKRYGMNGQEIKVYKFRSMYDNCDKKEGPYVQATKNDSRVTPVGAFLRRTSLDEIPQLFNVLQGHMSLVGPRPHPLAMDDAYRRSIAGYMTRNKVRPGITGLAQVRGYRGETDTIEKMEKRVAYDLKYIREWSLLYDVEILIRTAAVLLFQKTAY
jgi:putative colanic acid biosynthesis UDP-glucose lipid carrier transferase